MEQKIKNGKKLERKMGQNYKKDKYLDENRKLKQERTRN